MITYERLYRGYEIELAGAVLPGDDHLARERRAALSEMLDSMLRDGVALTLYTVGDRLATFVPQLIRESRSEQRWVEQTRPEIFKALADYFIEGGHEKRVRMQQKLLDALEASGIRIEGRDVLDTTLPWSGDWTERLLAYALKGRPAGVRFFGRASLLSSSARSALYEATFDGRQIQMFLDALN